MPLKIFLALVSVTAFGCSAVKYNSHVGSDGSNGYLRTYYSSAKTTARSEGTGIEQCKAQGSDVICKDLNIIHADEDATKGAQPQNSASAAAPAAKVEAPAVKAAAKKK